ncbi:MAG: hypothetical protein Q7S02_03815, partial [bacterium]|nr:hypothetical protein [bacterium]
FGSPERARVIAIPILGNDFLKIEDYLGVDIPAYITHLGGDATLFVKEIPIAEVVRGVVGGLGLTFPDPVIAKRIEGAITTHLSGARDTLETKDVLMRSVKVGGVGLDVATADRVTSALEEKLRALRGAGVILRKGNDKPPEESTFHLVKPAKSGLMQPEDEEEIERFRQVAPADPLKERTRATVDRIIQKTGAKFKNDDATRRFRTAIESRLRDIRDYRETLDLFMRPGGQGGFGISEAQAKKVLGVVEEEFAKLHAQTMGGQRQTIASSAFHPPTPPLPGGGEMTRDFSPSRQEGEREGVVGLTPPPAPTTAITLQLVHPVPPKPLPPPPPPMQASGVSAKPSAPTPPARTQLPSLGARGGEGELPLARNPSQPPLASRGGATPLQVVEQIPIAPPPPKSFPPAAKPPPPIVKQIPVAKAPTIPVPAPKLAPLPTPQVASRQVGGQTPPTPKAPPPQPAPVLAPRVSAPSGKPRLQDIRPVPPRLVGPIEELQRLAIQDFRKIAKLPAEAAARIVEKLALL